MFTDRIERVSISRLCDELKCLQIVWCRWTLHSRFGSSFLAFGSYAWKEGWYGVFSLWAPPSKEAWFYFAGFGVFEAALQLLLPGKTTYGPVTPRGNKPVYKVMWTNREKGSLSINFLNSRFTAPAFTMAIIGQNDCLVGCRILAMESQRCYLLQDKALCTVVFDDR